MKNAKIEKLRTVLVKVRCWIGQTLANQNGKAKLQDYVARFARNVVKWDIFVDFQTLCKSNRKKESVLDALTWHHYYLNGHTATLQDFLDVQPLDYLPKMFRTVQKFLKKKRIAKPLWLGETSSAYGGGAHGLSDRYVGSFLWLDKLGRVLHSVWK